MIRKDTIKLTLEITNIVITIIGFIIFFNLNSKTNETLKETTKATNKTTIDVKKYELNHKEMINAFNKITMLTKLFYRQIWEYCDFLSKKTKSKSEEIKHKIYADTINTILVKIDENTNNILPYLKQTDRDSLEIYTITFLRSTVNFFQQEYHSEEMSRFDYYNSIIFNDY